MLIFPSKREKNDSDNNDNKPKIQSTVLLLNRELSEWNKQN